MPTILVVLAALSGFVACFAVSNLMTWHRDERDHSARYFGLMCLGFSAYAMLQLAIMASGDLATTARCLRWQGVATAVVFVAVVRFGPEFARRKVDWFDFCCMAIYASLAMWSLVSPHGYWFAELTAIEAVRVSGGVLYQPRGTFAWTYTVSILVQYPVLLRQILDGRRAIGLGFRVDGWLWIACMIGVLLGGTHDHLVDLGVLSPPYIAEYPFPLAMLAMGSRFARRRSLEFVRLLQLQRTLASSEQKLRDLFESSSDAIFVHDAETGAIIDVNRTMCEMYGYPRERCLELTVSQLSAQQAEYSSAQAEDRLAAALQHGRTTFSWLARRQDQTVFPVEVTLKRTELNGKTCIVANVRDLSEREAAMNALRQEKTFVGTLLDSLPGTFCLCDRNLKPIRWNRNLEVLLGYASPQQLAESSMLDWCHAGAAREEFARAIADWLASDRINTQQQVAFRRVDGSHATYLITATKFESIEGGLLTTVGVDVSDLVQAQAELHEGEERYRTLFNTASDAILLMQGDRFIDCNESAVEVFGCQRREQLLGHSPQDFSPESQPDNKDSLAQARYRIACALSDDAQRFEWLHRRLDGGTFLAEVTLNRVDLKGARHLQAIVRDITNTRRLEEQLRQAQRLEAIGHLAGGVAHDFNNLLTPIVGHAELVLSELSDSHPAHDDICQVLSAAERARRLTKQLLSVGRRGVLEVRAINIGETVRSMEALFRSLLREDIALELGIESEGLVVVGDPSQLEQVLINLVANGRDAMPRGGRLRISASRRTVDGELAMSLDGCAPGLYVAVAVSDTGTGMTDEVRSRLFEPFFTTKTVGRGTGLGLPTVLGIVRQHRGGLSVESAIGVGSTLTAYLPATDAQPIGPDSAGAGNRDLTGSETVLVVEDDDSVRGLTCRALQRNGYRTRSASSAEDALGIIANAPEPLHLVVTDVVLPKMSGRELFDQLRRQRKDLRVLFMSGYSGDTISHHGILDDGVVLLQKPFTVEQLLAKVRTVLDA